MIVDGVALSDLAVSFDAAHPEGGPAFVLRNVSNVRFKDVSATEAEPKLRYDVGLRGDCSGVTVRGSGGFVLQNITR